MLFDDAARDAQSQPGAGRLGADERREQPARMSAAIPGPRVGHAQPRAAVGRGLQLALPSRPPRGMASRALSSRLTSTVRICPRSTSASSGSGGSRTSTTHSLLPRPARTRSTDWSTTVRRSQAARCGRGGRAKSRKPCTVPSRRLTSRVDDLQVFARQRLAVRPAQGGLDQHLDRRERVAHLVGDPGGELADGGELFAAVERARKPRAMP